jgi:hypothetical protein
MRSRFQHPTTGMCIMTIMAMQAGKDVCCEKPTWTIDLGRKLVNAIGKTDRVYAVSHRRSLATNPYYRMAHAWFAMGISETVTKMRTRLTGRIFIERIQMILRYSLFPKISTGKCGLARRRIQHILPVKHISIFAGASDYSVGSIADWGAHIIDRRCTVVQRHRKMGSG